MTELFKEKAIKEPLAYRMCPRTLEEYAGQEHLLGKGKLLRRAIEADRITSLRAQRVKVYTFDKACFKGKMKNWGKRFVLPLKKRKNAGTLSGSRFKNLFNYAFILMRRQYQCENALANSSMPGD